MSSAKFMTGSLMTSLLLRLSFCPENAATRASLEFFLNELFSFFDSSVISCLARELKSLETSVTVPP